MTEPLTDDSGNQRWHQHPNGKDVDVVALPISKLAEHVSFYPLDLSLSNTDLFAGVGMTVAIIGYPFGLTAGALFPIWKTGHIASEPEVDYNDHPLFLVDATTRPGMSGSPVVLRFIGHGYRTRTGVPVIAPGVFSVRGDERTRFMGVYSGRIHNSAEIGQVWRPQVIEEILPS